MPIPLRQNRGFCLRRFAMYADAPRLNGDFAKMDCVAGKTSSHRPKTSGPTRPFLQPTGMLLCATSCQNWSVKKKRPLSVSPILCSRVQSDRRGAQSPQKIQLGDLHSRSCLGFHRGCELVDLHWFCITFSLDFSIAWLFIVHCPCGGSTTLHSAG